MLIMQSLFVDCLIQFLATMEINNESYRRSGN